jgi:uncharacterized protein (TIGR02996 family)
MLDLDALLAAVLADPEDDLPRLVYADWLEENGDEAGRARAEFIRTQIALADAALDENCRPELEALERRLRKRYDRTWLGGLREHLHAWQYRRGFLDHVALDAHRLLQHHEALFAQHPVESVHLHNARDPGTLDRLGEGPFLARLHSLDLSNNPLAAGQVRGLLESPWLNRLRRLRFNDNPLGFDAIRCVAESPELGGLTVLELRRNNLTDDSVYPLADSPWLAGLTLLDLRGNAIGEDGRDYLTRLGAGVVRY